MISILAIGLPGYYATIFLLRIAAYCFGYDPVISREEFISGVRSRGVGIFPEHFSTALCGIGYGRKGISVAIGIKLTRSILPMFLLLTGCVSAGYHQRKIEETRAAELDYAIDLTTKICNKQLKPHEMLHLLKGRKNGDSTDRRD